MVSDIDKIFSQSAAGMKRSAIRELLKLTQQPDIISFGGGLPSPDSFPLDSLQTIVCELLHEEGTSALQYGTTEGDKGLRSILLERYKNEGIDAGLDNLIITTASQQGLDLLGRIFVDRGDKIVCGLPSYLGGLSAFTAYGAEMVGVQFDEYGMRSDDLHKVLTDMQANGEKPKFIYVIPDFQNPAGITMPEFRRKEILEIAYEFDLLVVEDSPYREIRFEGEAQRMIYDLDTRGQVILLGTFSKIFVPGFRIGWMLGPVEVIDKVIMAKQSADLCTSPFVQRIAARYLEKGLFDKNLMLTIDNYREKRDLMLDSFKKHMPDGVKWTEPEGGLFLFITLPDGMDAEKLFKKAIKNKVAFVMGHVFHCDGSGRNTMRINFSFVSKEDNVEGVKRLAGVIREEMHSLVVN